MKPRHVLVAAMLTMLGLVAPVRGRQATPAFMPPPGRVLVFVGQDNESVGGTEKYHDGYVDNVGVPAGITHYLYFSEGWKNNFGHTFALGQVGGLNNEVDWKAGPMCMKAYADSPKLKDCLFHVSISMEGDKELRVASGAEDHLIEELIEFLRSHSRRFFFLRIGYEFDGAWNKYEPGAFKQAFRRIVDHLRAAGLENFQTIMASSGMEKSEDTWLQYWPGDDYVDWIGYSYWRPESGAVAVKFARRKGLPAFIAESTPKGLFLDKMNGAEAWAQWFEGYFKHIQENSDVIRAISYINCNWNAQPMWKNSSWGNSRLEENAYVRDKWLEKMREPQFVNAADLPLKFVTANRGSAPQAQPNFVFIICDDLNDAVGCLGGHPQTRTPNMDRLAAQGVNFVNAQANVPICGPSRASLLTGLYPSSTGYYGYQFVTNHWRTNRVLASATTFIDHLRRYGYLTMGTGKIYHNEQEDRETWDVRGYPASWGPWPWDGRPDVHREFGIESEWQNSAIHPAMPKGFAVDSEFGSLDDIPDILPDPEEGVPGYRGWRLYLKPFRYVDDNDRDKVPDELNAEFAAEQLAKKHERPFLLCVGMNRPHAPMFVPKKYLDMFPLDQLVLPETIPNDRDDLADALDKHSMMSTGRHGFNKYSQVVHSSKGNLLKNWLQAYLAGIAMVDEQVGKVMEALRSGPNAENTYVILTSDHGYQMGEKEYLFKDSPWEKSTRIPFIVVGPNVQRGRSCDQPITLVDVYPTLADLAGIDAFPNRWAPKDVRRPLDGHSLVPLLRGETAKAWGGPAIALTAVASSKPLMVGQRGAINDQIYSVRSVRYRYILCPNGEEELYDHEKDSHEWYNVAKNPAYTEAKAAMRKELFGLLKFEGAPW